MGRTEHPWSLISSLGTKDTGPNGKWLDLFAGKAKERDRFGFMGTLQLRLDFSVFDWI